VLAVVKVYSEASETLEQKFECSYSFTNIVSALAGWLMFAECFTQVEQ
jgi:hypothetical protein